MPPIMSGACEGPIVSNLPICECTNQQIASTHIGQRALNIHRRYRYLVVAAGDVQQLPLQEGSFDAVLSSCVL